MLMIDMIYITNFICIVSLDQHNEPVRSDKTRETNHGLATVGPGKIPTVRFAIPIPTKNINKFRSFIICQHTGIIDWRCDAT